MKNNHDMNESEFQTIFNECLLRNPNAESKVSFKEFILICRNFKREYNKYRAFLPKLV